MLPTRTKMHRTRTKIHPQNSTKEPHSHHKEGEKEPKAREKKDIGKIFTDEGAKNYGEIAKRLFELHLKKKGISIEDGLQELATHLQRLPHSSPELVFQILLGNHDLTGLEMTNAYRYGACAMRTALVEWSNDSLEDLNKAFLNAVITKSLK